MWSAASVAPSVEHVRHRPVVDELHGHAGAEDALLHRDAERTQLRREDLVQPSRRLRWRRGQERRTVALRGVG